MDVGEQRVRVIAGTHRGRRIVAPKGYATRPTADRVREALFSRLGSMDAVSGASVLDAFAGAGALGIEALSRGAAAALFVERDRAALAALRGNLDTLGLASSSAVIAGDVFATARRGRLPGAPFALLFLDPPYRIDKAEVRGLIETLIDTGALAQGAVAVWEHDSNECPSWPTGMTDAGTKRYGDTSVSLGIWEGVGE